MVAAHGDDGGDSVKREEAEGEGSLVRLLPLSRFHEILCPPTSSEAVDRGPRTGGVLSAIIDAKSGECPTSRGPEPLTLEPRRSP